MKGRSVLRKNFDLALYVVTDRSWLNPTCADALVIGKQLEEQVEQAILGGATMVQLREKSLSTREFIDTAEQMMQITGRYGIPLIINDRLDVALAVDAAGLHVGQSDMSAVTARRLLGGKKILGVSVTNAAEAAQAEKDGADYLGVGAVFPTGTKNDAAYVELPELRKITRTAGIPVVAIGGINETNALKLKGAGVKGIAVVSAVFAQDDIKGATAKMKSLAEGLIGKTDER
jgi:thiamine-phosphate pyrophosphorylase